LPTIEEIMATFQFNPNGALDTGDELEFITHKMRDSLDELNAKVQQFIVANGGSGPDNFAAAQRMWNQGQQDMETSLAVGRQKLDQIREHYVLGDGRAASVFGSLI
jgi:uncharacterized protein YukE